MSNLTNESKALFIELAEDADNWNGQPLYERTDKASNGNLTDLKKKGFITTFSEQGCTDQGELIWVDFTEAGVEYAASIGIDLSWI